MHAQANAATRAAPMAGVAEWRARLAAIQRREAVGRVESVKACGECGAVPVVDRLWVRLRHDPECPLYRPLRAPRPPMRACRVGQAVSAAVPMAPAARSVPPRAPVPPEDEAEPGRGQTDAPAVADVQPAMRHCNRRGRHGQGQGTHGCRRRGVRYTTASQGFEPEPSELEREAEAEDGIRPWVVLRWFVSGCRVFVGGWRATVRGVIRRIGGRLKVWVDFDAGWASEWCDVVSDLLEAAR